MNSVTKSPLQAKQKHFYKKTAPGSLAIRMADIESAGRLELESEIAEKFARVHGACIEEFLPHLISLDSGNRLGSIAGLRLAGSSPLFLEQYLDAPIEQAISRAFGVPVDRNQIVEVGNLVSAQLGAASALFSLLPSILHAAGIRWVACTATPTVRALLSGLRFPSRQLGDAAADALVAGGGNWGNYYATRPAVIAGNVAAALRRATEDAPRSSLDIHQAEQISAIAARLRAARS